MQVKVGTQADQTRQQNETVQRQEQEITQSAFEDSRPESAQLKTLRASQQHQDNLSLQAKMANSPQQQSMQSLQAKMASKPNNTGLPNQLKAGIESLSGMSMDHVKVHYNSSKPAALQAHAYAQGSDIHVAPGQEQHVPHEAWHVVQQAQGRVKPTMQMKGGVDVNDDAGLEGEADLMGAQALNVGQLATASPRVQKQSIKGGSLSTVQRCVWKGDGIKWNLIHITPNKSSAGRPGKATAGAYWDNDKEGGAGTIKKKAGEAKEALGDTQRAEINLKFAEITGIINRITAANLAALNGSVADFQNYLAKHSDAQLDDRNVDGKLVEAKALEKRAITLNDAEFAKIKTSLDPAAHIIDSSMAGSADREPYATSLAPITAFYNLHTDGVMDARDCAPTLAAIVQLERDALDWFDDDAVGVGAAAPSPREAKNFFETHIMARHRFSSTAGDAGKFTADDWPTIRGLITTALGSGTLTEPEVDGAVGKPKGRFEIDHSTGGIIGKNIDGGDARNIFVVVSRTGKSVVTAYPY